MTVEGRATEGPATPDEGPEIALRWKGEWIHTDLVNSLPLDERIEASDRLFSELPLAEALIMIHGSMRGLERYWEAGGNVAPIWLLQQKGIDVRFP